MPQPPYRRPAPGMPLSGGAARRVLSDLEAIGMVRGGGDISVDEGGGGRQVLDQRLRGIPARITGYVSGNKYSFAQIDDGQPLTLPDLASQTPIVGDGTALAAYEMNGRTDVAAGTKVELFPLEYGPPQGGDPPGYRFVAPGGRQVIKGKLDADLAAGGSSILSVYQWNGVAEVDTGENLTVYDWNLPGGTTVTAGTSVEAIWVAGTGGGAARWYLIPPPALTAAGVDKGVLSGLLNQGSSATVRLWHVVSGTETDTGVDVTAYDWCLNTGDSIASGKHVFLSQIAGRYYVTQAAC